MRATEYALADRVAAHEFAFRVVTGSPPREPRDAMFYFTGAAAVADIGQVHFLPGAVADHLTSFGGMLTDSPQMTSLRWLEAGATGSYGTVVEPCNFLGKFPNVAVLLAHYLAGETLIEAYWKSVAMPGTGHFHRRSAGGAVSKTLSLSWHASEQRARRSPHLSVIGRDLRPPLVLPRVGNHQSSLPLIPRSHRASRLDPCAASPTTSSI